MLEALLALLQDPNFDAADHWQIYEAGGELYITASVDCDGGRGIDECGVFCIDLDAVNAPFTVDVTPTPYQLFPGGSAVTNEPINPEIQLGDALEEIGQIIRRRAILKQGREIFERLSAKDKTAGNESGAESWAFRANMETNALRVLDARLAELMTTAMALMPSETAKAVGEGR